MMPFVMNGEVWRVAWVPPGDPRLVDRTSEERVATTDPTTRTVYLSDTLYPPTLDHVLLHEVAHAATMSYGLLDTLREEVPQEWWVFVEEWAVQLLENHGIEAMRAASQSLGRPICVGGVCYNGQS